MDCRNIADATKMASELYKEAIHVPFMAKFVVFAKRVDPMEARLRVFCVTDDREEKTLEQQEYYTEVAKSRDVEVFENKIQYLELAGNLVAVTKSGEQLQFPFKAFKENRLPFTVRVKDQHADTVGRALFMREPKVAKGEQPQQPICCLNIVLPEDIIPEASILDDFSRFSYVQSPTGSELRITDISNFLGDDWIRLAREIGFNEEEIEEIIDNHPNSNAQQAQAMLKNFQSKKSCDINILETGLRTIGRVDIVERCLIRTITTTTTTTTKTVLRRQRIDSEESKYSAEEKVVDNESVAEHRERIEKRLSGEVKLAPSVQHKEIVEEITSIKRQSLIEEARAKHEDEILMQKPIDITYKSSIVPEQVIKLKTTSHDASTVEKTDFERELHEKYQKTQDFLNSEIQQATTEKTITTVTTTYTESAPTKREVITTTTTKTIHDEDEICEFKDDGKETESIQSKVITTTTVQPGETKEIITKTTIRTIESVSDDHEKETGN